jgi:hypothetical protein
VGGAAEKAGEARGQQDQNDSVHVERECGAQRRETQLEREPLAKPGWTWALPICLTVAAGRDARHYQSARTGKKSEGNGNWRVADRRPTVTDT